MSKIASRTAAAVRDEPRHQTLGEIGRGGLARVLEAIDRKRGRTDAIKELLADDEDGRRRLRAR